MDLALTARNTSRSLLLSPNRVLSDKFCDFICFIDGRLRINKAAQLSGAIESFDADLKRLAKIIGSQRGFYLGRYDRIVNVPRPLCSRSRSLDANVPWTFLLKIFQSKGFEYD